MLKNIRKMGLIMMLLVVTFSMPLSVLAETKSELQNQQADLDQKIKETSTELAGVKNQMSTALTQINRLNSQISDYENEITDLEANLKVLTDQITEKETNLKIEEEKFAEQQTLLEKRLIALYESGKTSYLDMLLSADDLSTFVSKYYLIGTLAEADDELLTQIENTKNQIAAEKTALETSKQEVEASKETVQTKKNALSVSVNEKNNLVDKLNDEEKTLQQMLEDFEEDKRRIQNKLAKISGSSNIVPVAPSKAGYTSPLPGKTKANITTSYYGYSGHTGVDWAVASGTPILAVKSGTVVISEALKYSSGRYRSYGEYIVIDHHDGTMTLYAHGYPGSRRVSPGDSVSQGQQIMSVGTTGNSTGNHLHFEVRINGRPVNPTSYLP